MSEMIQVPEGWEVIQLSDIGEVITGNTPSTDHEEYYGGSIPFIGPVDFQGQKYITNSEKKVTSAGLLQSRKIPSNSIMTVCIGSTIGKIAISTSESCTNQQVNSLQCSESFNPEFIYYSMNQFLQKQLEVEAGLQAVPIVNKSVFSRLFLLSPISKVEQHRIAEILSTLDRTIEASEKLIAKEKQIKKGLMHDLLTHGIDETGRIRTPQTHCYKKSELGMIPEGWECVQLIDVIPKVQYGISTSLSDEQEGIPVLRMNNLKNGTFILNDLKYSTTQEAYSMQIKMDDILFNRTNSMVHVGRTSIWKNQLANVSFASYLVKLIVDIQKIVPDFIVAWFNLEDVQNKMRNYATPGVQQVNINPTNLRKLHISYPVALDEQNKISKILTTQDKKIETEEANLAKLKELKKGLMNDLLSGRVRVRV